MQQKQQQSEQANVLLASTSLYVHGNLENPKIEFNTHRGSTTQQSFANTGMQTSETLSQAVNATGSPLTNKIQNKLNLQELGLESLEPQNAINDETPLANTVLVVGKRLSSRIYLQYIRGLLESSENDPLNLVRLKYALGKHWALSLETGNLGQGADLSFSVSRD